MTVHVARAWPTAPVAASPARRRGVRLLAWLALADLRHDAAFTISLVVAISSVVTPLLLILGLKYGLVEFQRQRLLQDPVNREITPVTVLDYDDAFFAALRARPDVASVIPSIMRGASTVQATAGDVTVRLDLLPTVAGDPLLLDNGVPVPGEGEAVLTTSAAARLRAGVGQTVALTASRRYQGRNETVATTMRVVGVLAARSDSLDRVYVPLSYAEDIETWRLGISVARRGWSGGVAVPPPSYDAILLVTRSALDSSDVTRLQIGTGVTSVEETTTVALEGLPHAGDAASGLHYYVLRSLGSTFLTDSLVSLANQTRSQGGILLPQVDGVRASVLLPAGEARVDLAALSIVPDHSERLGLAGPPWGHPAADRYEWIGRALMPSRLGLAAGSMVRLRLQARTTTLDLAVRVEGEAPGEQVVVPAELLGLFRTALDRHVSVNQADGTPMLDRPGYRGFRLYARTIDEVAALYQAILERGIEVTARLDDIDRVKRLDRVLSRLFWLLASVGIIGGIASLAASLNGAVQRKRRDFGMLRLLGLTRLSLLRFPLFQALCIALLAYLLALVGFYAFAALINAVFAPDLPVGNQLCRLPGVYVAGAGLLTIALAAASSVHAALAVMRIDPAEAIRVE